MATWPPTLTAQSRLEELRVLLAQGIDNRLTHPGIVEKLYQTVRAFTDLKPSREEMQLNPVEWLIKVLQWLTDYSNLPQGPMFFNTGSVLMNYTGTDFDFTFNHRYAGGASDPDGATMIQLNVGLRAASSDEVVWSEEPDCTWTLVIGEGLHEHSGDLPTTTDQCYFAVRARFIDAYGNPLSTWSVADERFVADT